MKKKYLLLGLITLSTPLGFVVSCNSNNNENVLLNETTDLKLIFQNNKTALMPLDTPATIKINNFINLTSWRNFEDLFSTNYLGKYFKINETFKQSFKEKKIYSKLRKITIEPIVGTKSLVAIFYLNQTSNDLNVASFKLDNALATIFNYSNKITVSNTYTVTKYATQSEFDKVWNEVNKTVNNINYTTLEALLSKAFGFDTTTTKKIVDNYRNNYFKLTKYSTTQIMLTLTSDALLNGFIFFKDVAKNQKYLTSIYSASLVK